VALPIGVAWGVIAAVIVGIPALRVKGLYLAVVTLGFGLAIRSWFIVGEKFAPGGGGSARLNVDRNEGFRLIFWTVKGTNFDGVYYFVLLMALMSVALVWRIRRTGIGRSIIATRDNETASSAYTVAPNRAKLLAFAVSGGLAALAGGLLPLVARNSKLMDCSLISTNHSALCLWRSLEVSDQSRAQFWVLCSSSQFPCSLTEPNKSNFSPVVLEC
jgi:ABC-type branched-subunit amino acid transport system permease subunit